MNTTIEITQALLDELNDFINDGYLLRVMQQRQLSIDSRTFLMQIILNNLNEAQQSLLPPENEIIKEENYDN